MKKKFFFAMMAALLAFAMSVLVGCPDSTPAPDPDPPLTPEGWTKGLESLVVDTGTLNGEISYQFDEAVPPTDSTVSTYQLYYVEGDKTSRDEIITACANPKALTPSTDKTVVIIDEDKPGTAYSVVLVAETIESKAYSGVKTVTSGKQLTVLTVTNIPNNVTIAVAALITQEGMNNKTPSYAGMNVNGTFGLFDVSTYASWYRTGEYFITLSENANPESPGKTWIYKGGQSQFTFKNGVNTIAWTEFVEVSNIEIDL